MLRSDEYGYPRITLNFHCSKPELPSLLQMLRKNINSTKTHLKLFCSLEISSLPLKSFFYIWISWKCIRKRCHCKLFLSGHHTFWAIKAQKVLKRWRVSLRDIESFRIWFRDRYFQQNSFSQTPIEIFSEIYCANRFYNAKSVLFFRTFLRHFWFRFWLKMC